MSMDATDRSPTLVGEDPTTEEHDGAIVVGLDQGRGTDDACCSAGRCSSGSKHERREITQRHSQEEGGHGCAQEAAEACCGAGKSGQGSCGVKAESSHCHATVKGSDSHCASERNQSPAGDAGCCSDTRVQEEHQRGSCCSNAGGLDSCCGDTNQRSLNQGHEHSHSHANRHDNGENHHESCCSDNGHHSGALDGCCGDDPLEDEDDDCCDFDKDSCSCDESCQYNYHLLYHQTIGCKRLSSLTPLIPEDSQDSSRRDSRMLCVRCLQVTKETGKVIPAVGKFSARKCYCSMTKALGKSVRTLAGRDFAKGCCKVKEVREQITSDDQNRHSHGHTSALTESTGDFVVDMPEVNEKGAIEMSNEVVRFLSLSLSGMTCSGCADKAAYVLRGIPGVIKEDVRVSFLVGRAELSFRPAVVTDIEKDITRRVKKLTGFDVVVLLNSEAEEDELAGLVTARIRSTHDIAEKLRNKLGVMEGVSKVAVLDSKEVQITYDPDETGIRTLLDSLNPGGDSHFDVELREAPDEETAAQNAEKKHLRLQLLQTLLIWMFTIPVAVFAWDNGGIAIDDWLRHTVECVCATCIIVIAHRIYLNAARTMVYGGAGALGGRVDVDTLVSVATLSAYGFSIAIFVIHIVGGGLDSFADKAPFFETSALLTALIFTGRWVTAAIRWLALKKVQGIAGSNLQEATVLRVETPGQDPVTMGSLYLHHGDILQAKKDLKVATDGIVIAGEAEVDESHLTGEAKPQKRTVGSYLLAGSTVVAGEVDYRVTRLLQENTIAAIKGMVTGASRQKPRTQEIADKVAAYLTPAILITACIVYLVWLLVEAVGRHGGWAWSAVTAATYAVATLAISCPCAIGLAVPMVLVVATLIGVTKGGFVFKNATAVEKGWKVTDVVFDKTGTLTSGELDVVYCRVLVDGVWQTEVPGNILTLVGELCRNASHPVAKGMFRFSGIRTPTSSSTTLAQAPLKVKTIVSAGLEADVDGTVVRGGTTSFTSPESRNHPELKHLLGTNYTLFTLSRDSELFAVFGLADKIRPETPQILQQLRSRGIELYIFSGDHGEAVHSVARELDIPVQNVRAGCKPEEKAAALETLRNSFLPTRRTFMFIGDGTNDAVALTTADIGVSLSKSTELAANSADIAILKDSLEGVIGFLELCRRVQICVYLNLSWAVLWNFVAILGACGALVKFRVAPEWAGLGELVSVTPVFLISAAVGVGWKRRS